MEQPAAPMALDTEGGQQRRKAMARFAVLRPVLDDEVPLTFAARAAGVPLRTAQRWLARYRMHGLSGLERLTRSDAGARQTPADLVGLIEGMALKRPRGSQPPRSIGGSPRPQEPKAGARHLTAPCTPSSRASNRGWWRWLTMASPVFGTVTN